MRSMDREEMAEGATLEGGRSRQRSMMVSKLEVWAWVACSAAATDSMAEGSPPQALARRSSSSW